MDRIEHREDRDFLARMISDRNSASLGSVNKTWYKTEIRVQKREDNKNKRKEKVAKRREEAETEKSMDSDNEEELDTISTHPPESSPYK